MQPIETREISKAKNRFYLERARTVLVRFSKPTFFVASLRPFWAEQDFFETDARRNPRVGTARWTILKNFTSRAGKIKLRVPSRASTAT